MNPDKVDSPYTYHLMVGASQLTQKRAVHNVCVFSRGKITASATRSPDCIAKEINRRLLRVIIPAWEKATVAYEQSISSERIQRALTRKLADILGETRLDSNGEYFTHYGYYRLWVKCHPQYTGSGGEFGTTWSQTRTG